MKDKKFIILLVIMVLIILAGIFNFLLMYETHKRVNILAGFYYEKRLPSSSRTVSIGHIITHALSIVDQNGITSIEATPGKIAFFPPDHEQVVMQLTCAGLKDATVAQIKLWNNPDTAKNGGQLIITAGSLPRWPDIELLSGTGSSTRITPHRVKHSLP